MRMWHRLAMANVATIVGALIVFGVILTRTSVDNLDRELDRRAQAGAQLIARQVDGVVRNLEYCGNTLVVMANEAVAAARSEPGLSVPTRTSLENQLSFALSVFPDVASAWLVLPDNQVISYGRLSAEPRSVARVAETSLRMDEPMGPSRLSTQGREELGTSVLVLAKRLINIRTGEPMASLVLVADAHSFEPILAQTNADFAARFRIVDGEGRTIVASPGARQAWEENTSTVREVEAALERIGWNVVSRISGEAVQTHTRRLIIVHVVILTIAAVVASAMALLVSHSITRPLESLERQMRKMNIEEGIGTISAPGAWEIQQVADGANRLLGRVHALVERVAAEERERHRYRLELLQAQTKPHFLYNSLEMVHMLGETGRHRRAQRAIRALSEFYRLSLAGGHELVSLTTELVLTEHYLFVQHLRYHDQFEYRVNREGASLDQVKLPKLTVQPLVENAIYHGIKGLSRRCMIAVTATVFDDGSGWQIEVSDDGRGMPQDRLDYLRELRLDASFGFRSIVQRLRLYLSIPIRYEIESAEEGGTTVTITAGGRPGEPAGPGAT